MDSGLARWSHWISRLASRLRKNTRAGSKKNIADHYDLSNEFFSLFLDESMMYSSAVYDAPDMSLEQASQAKQKHLCRRLRLEASDHLLEIGTGWGGLAEYASRNYGCKVTTTTISQKQYDYTKERIEKAGLADRITLLQQDYRDLTGQYDKIVSVEMIEAVGKEYLDGYFRCCNNLLKRGGRFVIQAIVIPEQRFDIYSRSVDFIQAYIFPGSFLPSIASMQLSAGRATSLRLVGLEDFTPSYVLTLQEWRRRFHHRLDEVRALGFDERFIRMWDFYLCSCEAVFLERAASLVQMEWIKV
ncbi:MAG: cyclopropane-fatty-acyl-phospholipid synthase family protein [Gemmatales bacterium]